MTIGTSEYALDAKHRMVVPPRFRDSLIAEGGTQLFIAKGFDGCLWLYLPSQWERALEDVKEATKDIADKKKARAFRRAFFGNAEPVELDSQGRILISPVHVDYARLKKEVVVAGAGNKLEIWDRKRWKAYNKSEAEPSFSEISQELDI